MFGDMGWDDARTDAQHATLETWLDAVKGPLVLLELGAGTNVPTVRIFSERVGRGRRRTFVRVNPREPLLGYGFESPAPDSLEALLASTVPSSRPVGISIPLGALDAIRGIDARRRPSTTAAPV
jgi:hypothetical protein